MIAGSVGLPETRRAKPTSLNALGDLLDVPGASNHWTRNGCSVTRRGDTGLSDFGDDEWRPHFRTLIRLIEDEAKLHFFGRVLTRSDLLIYLQARLQIVDAFKKHPEIEGRTNQGAGASFWDLDGRARRSSRMSCATTSTNSRSVYRKSGAVPVAVLRRDLRHAIARIARPARMCCRVLRHLAGMETHAWLGREPGGRGHRIHLSGSHAVRS